MTHSHLGVFIGRFQPLHLGHVHIIEQALKHCDRLLIVIGSAFRARNFKNPWTIAERQALIQSHFPKAPIQFAAIPDFFYHETAWVNAVKNSVRGDFAKTTLFGYDKDASTYYLQEFPEWNYHALPNFQNINATQIRQDYFWKHQIANTVPSRTAEFLEAFKTNPEYARLEEEAQFVREYQHSWRHSPYAPIFVTTDAVVTCQEHILLIKRKFCPGKGLYALPGGFLEETEWIKTGLIRELKEETAIDLTETTLLAHLKTLRFFDHPDRSLIGRVITHAGHFDLPAPRPKVQAADDALAVEWIPLAQLVKLRDQFHDDHYQIINTLLNRSWL